MSDVYTHMKRILELEGIGEMSDVYTYMKRIPGREQLA